MDVRFLITQPGWNEMKSIEWYRSLKLINLKFTTHGADITGLLQAVPGTFKEREPERWSFTAAVNPSATILQSLAAS